MRDLLAQPTGYEPAGVVSGADGSVDRIWVLDQPERIQPILKAAGSQPLSIVEGHHGYEAALAYRNEVREQMRAAGRMPPALGEIECDWVLMLIVPDSDPGLVLPQAGARIQPQPLSGLVFHFFW